MKRLGMFFYSVKQGIKSIRRNRMFSLASIGTISACLFLFGIFYFLVLNFQFIIKNAESSVGITVFFDAGLKEDDIYKTFNKIKQRAEVDKINYVSAEEAWEKFKKEYFEDDDSLTDTFAEDNPLADSASLEVYLNDVSMQESLVIYIEKIDGVRQVNSSDSTARGINSFNMLVGYISGAIILILLAVAIFLISTTVSMGISVRKEEITIMRLIGASDFFIRGPFIVEGIVIGFIGSIIPLVLLYIIYNQVISYIGGKFDILTGLLRFVNINKVFAALGPISLSIGIGIGFIGSYLTVRKHIRV